MTKVCEAFFAIIFRIAAEELNYSYTWGQWVTRRGIAEVQGILDGRLPEGLK